MGIRPYIDDDLQAGRLVTPFPLTVPKGQQWYLIYRDIRRDQPDFATFRKWIIAAAGEQIQAALNASITAAKQHDR